MQRHISNFRSEVKTGTGPSPYDKYMAHTILNRLLSPGKISYKIIPISYGESPFSVLISDWSKI